MRGCAEASAAPRREATDHVLGRCSPSGCVWPQPVRPLVAAAGPALRDAAPVRRVRRVAQTAERRPLNEHVGARTGRHRPRKERHLHSHDRQALRPEGHRPRARTPAVVQDDARVPRLRRGRGRKRRARSGEARWRRSEDLLTNRLAAASWRRWRRDNPCPAAGLFRPWVMLERRRDLGVARGTWPATRPTAMQRVSIRASVATRVAQSGRSFGRASERCVSK